MAYRFTELSKSSIILSIIINLIRILLFLAYLDLVQHIRKTLPNVTLSTDMITGFCGETEEEFQDTLSLLNEVKYNMAFLFPYSMREKTTAHRRMQDDVPEEVKKERLIRMIQVFRKNALEMNSKMIGGTELILIENVSIIMKKFFKKLSN